MNGEGHDFGRALNHEVHEAHEGNCTWEDVSEIRSPNRDKALLRRSRPGETPLPL
jgi:hypothetical protein